MATWSKNELATAMGTKQQDSSRAHELGTLSPFLYPSMFRLYPTSIGKSLPL